MSKKIDLTGKNFGRLTVLKDSGKRSRKGDILWKCICECGRLSFVRGYQLKRGTTKSCGCLARELAIKRGKKIRLGRFIEKQDAIGARKEAEEKYFEPILEKYKT